MDNVDNVREGFVEKTVTAKFRKNGKYIQMITVDAEGKEHYFIIQEVPSLRTLYKPTGMPF